MHLQYLDGIFDRGYMHIWKNLDVLNGEMAGELNLSAGFSPIPGAHAVAVPLTHTLDLCYFRFLSNFI